MDIIFFTKLFKGWTCERVGERVKEMGFDGIDVAIRAGQCVEPANAATALKPAVKLWDGMGLTCPLATLEGFWTNPDDAGVQTVYRACADAGVTLIKLGYWSWKPETHYWDHVEVARRDLEKFARLSEKLGVTTLLHTHSGGHYASNAAGAMHFLRGFDPRHVALYLDPAHLAFGGEPLPMAVDMTRGYLKMVGVKNAAWIRETRDGKVVWKKFLPLLEEGLVDWAEAIRLFRAAGFRGPLAYHAEVDTYRTADNVGEAAKRDLPYLRRLLAAEPAVVN
jgi:L-ribulose-5-phosphate 3-epimerase